METVPTVMNGNCCLFTSLSADFSAPPLHRYLFFLFLTPQITLYSMSPLFSLCILVPYYYPHPFQALIFAHFVAVVHSLPHDHFTSTTTVWNWWQQQTKCLLPQPLTPLRSLQLQSPAHVLGSKPQWITWDFLQRKHVYDYGTTFKWSMQQIS